MTRPTLELDGLDGGEVEASVAVAANRPGPRLIESLEVLVREAASIMPCG